VDHEAAHPHRKPKAIRLILALILILDSVALFLKTWLTQEIIDRSMLLERAFAQSTNHVHLPSYKVANGSDNVKSSR